MNQHPTHNPPEASHKSNRRKLHKDWRLWAVVLLMLLAMVIYLATLDERIVPGGQPGTNATAGGVSAPR